MKIAFNPSTVAALTTPPNNKDITFDLRGQNIFARGVKFYGTDTNTWRDIKVNNVSIGSHTLDLRNGSNTTLTNTNGVVTINSTWRPVVDNLTSNSTTSSLSANQGRVLKALIGGKSDSGHNHDGRYVRYYAVTTLDCNNLAVGLTAARVSATNAAHTNNSVYLYISDIGTPFQIQIPDSNVPYIYKRYYSSGKWSGWFKLNAGYADSAGNASTLGGTSLSGLFTAFGNNAHNITATIGGVTKSFLVNWAADSDKLDGKHASDFAAASHTHKWADITDRITKLSQLTNDKGFVTGSVSGKTITINGTSTTWSNTWRPISDDYELGESGTSLSTLGSLTMYNDLLGSIPNPTSYYWANIKVSSSSSTTTSPTVHTLNATRVCAGHNPGIDNSISCSNWFRSSGNTGWYSTSYGGGWYMSDKDWIRSWGSKALYINNSIRSTNYQVMYGSTSVSAAKLESANTLVYGTDTSSQSINTYLRGTNVIMQVKKGTSINYNALQLTANYIYCNNYCAMKYGAAVNGGNFTVFTDSYLAQLIGSKVGIGTKNPQYTLDVGDTMRAGGYIHSGHNSNDAMLLAGGGWKKLSTLVEYPSDENYIYRKTTTEYDLRFVKLVNFNNLIYVDGWISADANGKSFTLGAKFKPYLYRDDHSMPTIVQMGWDDVVTIDGDGNVGFHIEGGRKKRIGFFYTGRA